MGTLQMFIKSFFLIDVSIKMQHKDNPLPSFQETLSIKMSDSVPQKVDKSTQTDPQEQTSGSSNNKKKKILKEVGWFALKTAGISTAVLGGVALAVPALGFTAGGIAAGSLAAAYQSAFLGGRIASGSAFAKLQSIGAAGLAISTKAGIVAASAAASGAHSAAKNFKKDQQREHDGKEKEADEYDGNQTDITTGNSKRNASTQTNFKMCSRSSNLISNKRL